MCHFKLIQSYINQKAGMNQINERRVLFNERIDRPSTATFITTIRENIKGRTFNVLDYRL